MKKIISTSAAFLVPASILLSGCGEEPVDETNTGSSSTGGADSSAVEMKEEKLAVIPEKCIGCGKCVRVAPNHFGYDYSTHKAFEKSQKNLDAPEVSTALRICPTDAIVL